MIRVTEPCRQMPEQFARLIGERGFPDVGLHASKDVKEIPGRTSTCVEQSCRHAVHWTKQTVSILMQDCEWSRF